MQSRQCVANANKLTSRIFVYMYMYMYVCMYICVCICMYVCMCIYIYIYTKILEVNLFAFAYRLFRTDFSPLDWTFCIGTHSIFSALYVFYVNLGGFYEWVVLIFFLS